MLRTGHLLRPASNPASRPRTGASLPGTLASPRTGLAPAGCPQLLAWLRHHNMNLLVVMASKLLDALPNRRERVTLRPFSCSDAVPHHVTGALRRPIRQRPRLIVAHQPRSSSRVRNALSSGAGESVDRGSRLFEFLPVRPPEEPGESGTEGRTFVVFRVEVKNRGSVRCR